MSTFDTLLLLALTFSTISFADACCPGLRHSFGKREALYQYDTNATKECKDLVLNSKYTFDHRGTCFKHASFFSRWWCSRSCSAECKSKPFTFITCGLNCKAKMKNGTANPTIQCFCGKCKTKEAAFKEISQQYEKECLKNVALPPAPSPAVLSAEVAKESVIAKDVKTSDCSREHQLYFEKTDPETKALLMEIMVNVKSGQQIDTETVGKLREFLNSSSVAFETIPDAPDQNV